MWGGFYFVHLFYKRRLLCTKIVLGLTIYSLCLLFVQQITADSYFPHPLLFCIIPVARHFKFLHKIPFKGQSLGGMRIQFKLYIQFILYVPCLTVRPVCTAQSNFGCNISDWFPSLHGTQPFNRLKTQVSCLSRIHISSLSTPRIVCARNIFPRNVPESLNDEGDKISYNFIKTKTGNILFISVLVFMLLCRSSLAQPVSNQFHSLFNFNSVLP